MIFSVAIKQRLFRLAEGIHLRIFGHEMGEEMRKFLGHLSWSFFGIFFSALILFVVNILAARILGPDGYGKYNFAISVANMLSVVLLFGFDTTAIKFIVQSRNDLGKNQHLSNLFWVFLSASSIASLSLLFMDKIDGYLSIGRGVFVLIVAFSVTMSLKSLLDSYMRSFGMFSFQTKIKLLESLSILFVFTTFYFLFRETDFRYYLMSLIFGAFIASVFFLQKVYGKLIKVSPKKLGEMWPYIKTNFLLTILGVFITSLDKIYMGKFIGTRDLGMYSAYILASTLFIGQVILVFNNVFFPMIASVENKDLIMKKIDKIALLFFVPGTLGISVFSVIIIRLLGKEFEYNHLYILAFSFLAFLQIVGSFYRSVVLANIETYDRLKRYSYFMFLFLLSYYTFIYVKDLNLMFYIVVAYSLYVIINVSIMRMSYKKFDT